MMRSLLIWWVIAAAAVAGPPDGMVAVDARLLLLKVEAKGQAYSFFYAAGNNEWNVVQTDVDGRTLSRTNAGGFTGTMIGPYASSNGSRSSRFVDVDWFEYREAASK